MRKRGIHRLFGAALIFKGIDGVLEVIGGIIFWVVDPRAIGTAVSLLTAHEFSEDPSDRVVGALRRAAGAFTTHPGHFASVYLIGHGLIKIFLVVSVLRERRWAFIPALVFMAAFVVYQLYRFAHSESGALLAFTFLDVVVMYFIWREYRNLPRASTSDQDSPYAA